MSFHISTIRQDTPGEGKVIVYWLSGSGFAFKFATGEVIAIDPYLSDFVERIVGFRRLVLPPTDADSLEFDALLLTHDHGDHLDIDSFEAMMARNPRCRVLAPECCQGYLDDKSIPYDPVRPGTDTAVGGVTVRTVDADHADQCLTAVGYLITFAGRTIYFTGDTCLNEPLMADAIEAQPEILIPCINGAFGNLSEMDAAKLAALCGSKIAIPSHFWLFAEQHGDPGVFIDEMSTSNPESQVVLTTPGRGIEI